MISVREEQCHSTFYCNQADYDALRHIPNAKGYLCGKKVKNGDYLIIIDNDNSYCYDEEINEWIRPVIYENSTASSSENNIETRPPFDLTQLTSEELSFNTFDPGFLTYYPNSSFQFYEDEPMWILPSLKYDFIWDFTMSPEQETISNLINRPLKNKALSEEQTNYLLESIGENPAILKEINFS